MSPRKKVEPTAVPADSNISLYKDRSGKPMGGMHREGSSYMGFVAEQARAAVANQPAEIDGNESKG